MGTTKLTKRKPSRGLGVNFAPPAGVEGIGFNTPTVGSSTSNVTLSWNTASGADTYEYTAGASDGVSWAGQQGVGVTGLSVVLNNVPNGLPIFAGVRSKGQSGDVSDFNFNNYTVPSAVATATMLGMVQQPVNVIDGVVLSSPPSARLLDQFGVAVSQADTQLTVSLVGTGSLGGTPTALTNSNGIAVFPTVFVDVASPPATRQMAFASPGIIGVTSADFVVSAAPSPGQFPNQGSLTTLSEIDFSQTVTVNGAIGNGFGWDSGGHGQVTKITDALEPLSGGTCWEWKIPHINPATGTGVWGSPTSGFGFGGIYYNIGSTHGFKREVYLAASVWWDSNYEWHPVSNKWYELGSAGPQQLLCQSNEGGAYLRPEELYPTYQSAPGNWGAFSLGTWHVFEIYVNYVGGIVKVWLDGTQRINHNGMNIALVQSWQEIYLRTFLGGGGMTRTRDSYYRLGHIRIAGTT